MPEPPSRPAEPPRSRPARRPRRRRASAPPDGRRTSSTSRQQKIAGRFVLDQMMGQDAGRLAAVDPAAAARLQMRADAAKRRASPTNPRSPFQATRSTCDIRREQACARPCRTTWLDLRNRGDAATGEQRQKASSKRFHGGARTGSARAPNNAAQPFPARGKLGRDRSCTSAPPEIRSSSCRSRSRGRHDASRAEGLRRATAGAIADWHRRRRAGPPARAARLLGSPRAPPARLRQLPAGGRGGRTAPQRRRHATTR